MSCSSRDTTLILRGLFAKVSNRMRTNVTLRRRLRGVGHVDSSRCRTLQKAAEAT